MFPWKQEHYPYLQCSSCVFTIQNNPVCPSADIPHALIPAVFFCPCTKCSSCECVEVGCVSQTPWGNGQTLAGRGGAEAAGSSLQTALAQAGRLQRSPCISNYREQVSDSWFNTIISTKFFFSWWSTWSIIFFLPVIGPSSSSKSILTPRPFPRLTPQPPPRHREIGTTPYTYANMMGTPTPVGKRHGA